MTLELLKRFAEAGIALAGAGALSWFAFRRGHSQATARMNNILDAMPDMIIILDKNQRVIRANTQALHAMGLPEREVLEKKCHELLHRSKAPPESCPCLRSMHDRQPHTSETEDTVLGIPVSITILPVLDAGDNVTHFVHVIKDISSRKNLENRLVQSGKMEALGRLAGALAHEFNNILSIISSAFYMLKTHISNNEGAKEDGAAIQKAIAAASDLTRHLITISQRQILDLKPSDINLLMKESVQLLSKLLGEHTRIETDFKNNLPVITGDPAQLNRLLISILLPSEQNAAKQRAVLLKTEEVELRDTPAVTALEAKTKRIFVKISVKDSAYSVKKELINHIFEPYFDSRSMSLAIAYNIAKQHGGWIDVLGEENGLTFEIYLPAAEQAISEEKHRADAPKIRAKILTILLAEDDEDLRVLTARTLRKNGHTVFEAGSAEQALEIFDKQKGIFDTLISDVVMPDKSGVDLADAVLKANAAINVILMSGYIDDKVHVDTIQKKGYKFIYKPFDVDALLTMLKY